MRILAGIFALFFLLSTARGELTSFEREAEAFAEVYSLAYALCKTTDDNPEAQKNFCDAVEDLERSLDQGYPEALFAIGAYYASGKDAIVGKDNFLTFKWLNKAAKKGHAKAQRFAGAMYLQGIGVRQDIEEGINYLKSAGNQGDVDSYMILGTLFLEGELVKRDLKKAMYYYGAMCDLGEQLGCDFYKEVNEALLKEKYKE